MDSLLTGQNNRWTYCGNDPVNASDPTGEVHLLVVIIILIALFLFAWGLNIGVSLSRYASANWQSFLTAAGSTLGCAAIAKALAAGELFSIAGALAAGFFPVIGILLACFAVGFLVGVLIGVLYDSIAEYASAEITDPVASEESLDARYCLWRGTFPRTAWCLREASYAYI
jgi:hypothetical protein